MDYDADKPNVGKGDVCSLPLPEDNVVSQLFRIQYCKLLKNKCVIVCFYGYTRRHTEESFQKTNI